MKRTLTVGLVAALAFVSAACGDDDDSSTASDSGSRDVTTVQEPQSDATTGENEGSSSPATAVNPTTPATEMDDVPQRIVSLSPTHTEILFAVGAGDQVIAVDSFSNYPEAALEVQTDLSGLEPNVEAISEYEPDLVILEGEGSIVEQLERLDIETWIGPAARNLGDVYAQIEQLGATTGHVGDAAALVGQMQADIEQLTMDLPRLEEPLTYYHELDSTYFSVTSDTFIGNVYSLLGLRNIADQVEGDSGGYPQLSAEFIVEASPDLIFLADTVCCGETAESVAERDGWGAINAVQNGLVVEMNDDIASRWGPRIVDYLRQVRAAVEEATATQPASLRSVLPDRPDREGSKGQTGEGGGG